MIKKIENWKLKIGNSRKGFTLIELLVYSGVFAIILAVAISLFFQTRTLESEVIQVQEIDRNARVAFLEMAQTLRGASNVSSPSLGVSAGDVYLNSNAIGYFVNNGILQKTESGQTVDLTSDEVAVENITFTTRGEVGGRPTVSISFDVTTNTLIWGRADYISKSFQTTVQLRCAEGNC